MLFAIDIDGTIADKLIRLADLIKAERQQVMLIDDQYMRLLEEFGRLDKQRAELLRTHLVLAAFRASCLPSS